MIPASAIQAQLDRYAGWTYAPTVTGLRDCRYPTPIPGPVHTRRPPPRQTDCVCFVEGVVLGACHEAGILVDWPMARHNQALLARQEDALAVEAAIGGDAAAGAKLGGPVDALVAAGLAEHVGLELPPLGWSVAQGWSHDYLEGHAWLMHCSLHHEVTVHECARGAGGVRSRAREWAQVRRWSHLFVGRLLTV